MEKTMQNNYLQLAIDKAKKSFELGGFPAGAIIVKDGEIIGEGVSTGLLHNDPVEHGEINAIKKACLKLNSPWIKGATLYSSMEPCLMCLGACGWANIQDIYFACKKETAGNGSYLGGYSNQDIVNTFDRKINLNYVDIGFEKELLEMIKTWEIKTFG
jgi:tRNA(Arg) A34 adenosine deaminase TadA